MSFSVIRKGSCETVSQLFTLFYPSEEAVVVVAAAVLVTPEVDFGLVTSLWDDSGLALSEAGLVTDCEAGEPETLARDFMWDAEHVGGGNSELGVKLSDPLVLFCIKYTKRFRVYFNIQDTEI